MISGTYLLYYNFCPNYAVINIFCLSWGCNFFTNQPHKIYQNLQTVEEVNPNPYAMQKCTPDIFSPPPSNWLRLEVNLTNTESC